MMSRIFTANGVVRVDADDIKRVMSDTDGFAIVIDGEVFTRKDLHIYYKGDIDINIGILSAYFANDMTSLDKMIDIESGEAMTTERYNHYSELGKVIRAICNRHDDKDRVNFNKIPICNKLDDKDRVNFKSKKNPTYGVSGDSDCSKCASPICTSCYKYIVTQLDTKHDKESDDDILIGRYNILSDESLHSTHVYKMRRPDGTEYLYSPVTIGYRIYKK